MSLWFDRILFLLVIIGFGYIIYLYQSKFAWWKKDNNIKMMTDKEVKQTLNKIEKETIKDTQQKNTAKHNVDIPIDDIIGDDVIDSEIISPTLVIDKPSQAASNPYDANSRPLNPLMSTGKRRRRLAFDISVSDEYAGRVVVEVFNDIVPKTAENFVQLAKSKYAGTIFHRLVPNFVLQGGDFLNHDGTGSMSIYGAQFEDENFNVRHDRAGILSMANTGRPHTNGSQFFITLAPTPHLDNHHVAFGRVVEGMELIHYLASVEIDHEERPLREIKIQSVMEIFE